MIFFNLSEYKDIRYHDFHILIPGRSHRFKDVPDPMLIEDFLRKHADLIHQNLYRWYYSFYISFAYLITIWLLKNWMKKREPFRMRSLLITWNILLSIFSLIGSYRVLPEFISVLYDHGFLYSISRSSYYFDYRVSAWYILFTLSKAVELLDTGFVLLRKKPLIVLHWIHHLLTLNFSWFVFSNAPATARWMVTMNFFIHTFMYAYYAFKVAGYHIPKRISLCITISQILQMFIGLIVNYKALQLKLLGLPCDGSFPVLITAVTLYGLFAILFVNFFIWTYIIKRSGKNIRNAMKHFTSEMNNNEQKLCNGNTIDDSLVMKKAQ